MGTPVIDSLRPYCHAKIHFSKGVLLEEIYNSVMTIHSSSYMTRQGEYITGDNTSSVTIPDFVAGAPINVFIRAKIDSIGSSNGHFLIKINTSVQKGFFLKVDSLRRLQMAQYCEDSSNVSNTVSSAIELGKWYTLSCEAQSDSVDGVRAFINGIQSGASGSTVGKTIRHLETTVMRIFGYATNQLARGVVSDILIFQNVILTPLQHAQISAELNSISYPTSVYEIRPPDYPTIKDGTPSFALCCGDTTDKANGVTPTTATAVQRKKDTQMADYLQFTRTSSSKLDYGIQTGNQLNAEFEWDGDVYFDTDAVGQITELVKIGDSATGVCWGLRKLATERFQFIYGNELTVDFTYSVPSLGPLHIVLRREWVSGSTYDVKLWINGAYKEKVTGTYVGTGNASAKTYIGYSGNITNTNFLSGRIYYSHIYPHLRPIEKFQRDPFSKNLMLGWGIRANNTVSTTERDTDGVVNTISDATRLKINSGFSSAGRLQKWLEGVTTAGSVTFKIRGVENADGLTFKYKLSTSSTWLDGNGVTSPITVSSTGVWEIPLSATNYQILWSELG